MTDGSRRSLSGYLPYYHYWLLALTLTAALFTVDHDVVALGFLAPTKIGTTTLTTTTAMSTSPKLLVRQIRSQPTNVTHALDIVARSMALVEDEGQKDKEEEEIESSPQMVPGVVVVEALRVFGRARRPELALDLYHQYHHRSCSSSFSESVRTMTISVLGNCGQHMQALELLPSGNTRDQGDNHHGVVGVAGSYNAAIAACGKKNVQDWQLALDIYERRMPPQLVSTVTINAVMSCLTTARQGMVALELLERLLDDDDEKNETIAWERIGTNSTIIDGVTLQLVISALVRSDHLTSAYRLLRRVAAVGLSGEERKIGSFDTMCDQVASAFDRQSDWNGVRQVAELRRGKAVGSSNNSRPFQHWQGLEKVGKGKEAYWVIGTYHPLNLTIGVHPNRNAAQNGMQLVFLANQVDDATGESKAATRTRKKIGFLLMKNSCSEYDNFNGTSSLLGMFLEPNQRGKGLAKICLAIWIWFCLEASIQPCTGVIHKPLLSLVLQYTFGFVPAGDAGVEMELCQDASSPETTLLYSSSGKSLEGVFSPWDQEHQNIRLESHPPQVRGRKIRTGCQWTAALDGATLQRVIEEQLLLSQRPGHGTASISWDCNLSGQMIQQVFLGKEK